MPAQKRNTTKYPNVYWIECTFGKKPDKSYFVIYRDENGVKRQKTIGRESQRITASFAHQKQIEIVNKIRLGEDIQIKGARRKIFTFHAAFHHYLEYAKNNKKSWRKDQELFNNHLKEIHGRELIKLTQKDFNDIKATKQNKMYADSTIKSILAVARQIINYAINHELIKNYSNPIAKGRVHMNNPIAKGRVHMKQPKNEKLGFLTKENSDLIEKEFKKKRSPHLYNLTVMGLSTGARFSEIASLTWEDINFNTNLIYFKATKKGNSRHIAMTEKVKDVIISQKENGNFLVFPDANGNQMRQIDTRWQKTVDLILPNNKKISIKDKNYSENKLQEIKTRNLYRITFHSLRHTYASRLAMSGIFTVMEIQKQLGHKTIQMTQRYSHLISEPIQDKHLEVINSF